MDTVALILSTKGAPLASLHKATSMVSADSKLNLNGINAKPERLVVSLETARGLFVNVVASY